MSSLSQICPHLSPLPMEKPWGKWTGKTKNVWLKRVWRRLYSQNQNVIAIAYGPPGSGKSTLSLALCEMIDPAFDISRVVFNVKSLWAILQQAEKGEILKGSAILFEEVGVAADSRKWHDQDNITFSHALQTFRPYNIFLINTVPALELADRRISILASCLIEAQGVDFKAERTRCRIYDPVRFDSKTSKWFKRQVGLSKMSPNGYLRSYKYGQLRVGKPSRALNKAYITKREEYATDLLKRGQETLNAPPKEAAARTQINTEQLNDMVSKVIGDRDKFMKTVPGVGVTRFDLSAVQATWPELGLSNAKKVKSAVKMKMKEMGFELKF